MFREPIREQKLTSWRAKLILTPKQGPVCHFSNQQRALTRETGGTHRHRRAVLTQEEQSFPQAHKPMGVALVSALATPRVKKMTGRRDWLNFKVILGSVSDLSCKRNLRGILSLMGLAEIHN